MGSDLIQVGILVEVFGGFLLLAGTGGAGGFGFFALFIGLILGLYGYVNARLGRIERQRVRTDQ